MSSGQPLKLYYHPLSSYCHKALIALYENDIAFEPVVVDFSDEEATAALNRLWPIGKFPVLRDDARGHTVAEATVIIEYLDTHYARSLLLPADGDEAWQARMWDRFIDLYIHDHLQKIVGDNLRPADARDPLGVQQAMEKIGKSYGILESKLGDVWAMGERFGLVDCAAAPALFYANCAVPISDATPKLVAYYRRLMTRPSYARALNDAEPFFHWVPLDTKPTLPV